MFSAKRPRNLTLGTKNVNLHRKHNLLLSVLRGVLVLFKRDVVVFQHLHELAHHFQPDTECLHQSNQHLLGYCVS